MNVCRLHPNDGGSAYVVYQELQDGALQPLGRIQRAPRGRGWRYEGDMATKGFGNAETLQAAVAALCV